MHTWHVFNHLEVSALVAPSLKWYWWGSPPVSALISIFVNISGFMHPCGTFSTFWINRTTDLWQDTVVVRAWPVGYHRMDNNVLLSMSGIGKQVSNPPAAYSVEIDSLPMPSEGWNSMTHPWVADWANGTTIWLHTYGATIWLHHSAGSLDLTCHPSIHIQNI